MARRSGSGRRPLVLVLLVALLPGAARPVAAQDGELARIRRDVADLRGHAFAVEVDPVFIDRAALRRRLIDDYRADEATQDAPGYGRALRAFGLLPEGAHLLPLRLEAATTGVAGFYDNDTGELVLIGEDDGDLSDLEEWVYVHELAHALQDQRLGLDRLDDRSDAADDDADLAMEALVEGDASAVNRAYAEAHPPADTNALGDFLGALGTLPRALSAEPPLPLIAHTTGFPYGAGRRFVDALRDEGGWAAVDAAFSDPPASTEQVLHPEKYHGERDDPTPVVLPDPAPALGAGWETVHENVLGEFQIAVLLANQEETGPARLPDAATDAAAGWDGDRYALRSDGEAEVLIWQSLWDDADEAAAFAAALRTREENRTGARWTADGGTDLIDGDRALRLHRDGTAVTYVVAPDPEAADAVLALVEDA